MTATRALRSALVLLLALAAALIPAGAASAHVLKGQYANNWATAITSVTPAVPGLTATVTTDGQTVTVSYTGTQTVTIYGYAHDPYLRITPAGLDENVNSLSVDLNQSQNIGSLGDVSTLDKPPSWKHVSNQKVASWHDHRVHWMDSNPPPVAQQDPGHDHVVKSWTIGLAVGSTPVTIHGTLTWLKWIPGSKTALIVTVAAGLLVVAAVILLVRWRRSTRRLPVPVEGSTASV